MSPRLACAALLVAASAAGAEPRTPDLVLEDVNVVDGTGGPARPHQTLVVSRGRIAALGPTSEVTAPRGAEVLPLSGHTVVPGFVDLHVHLPTHATARAAILAQLLEYGVTTVLNPGARPGAGVVVREQLRRGELRGPRLVTAGRILDGDPPEPGLAHWCAVVDNEEAARREVRAQVEAGVDWIKLYKHVRPAVAAAAIGEAQAHGLRVVMHAGETSWAQAARLGVDMLVHSGYGTPMEQWMDLEDPHAASDAEWYGAFARSTGGEAFARLAAELAAADVTVVPTLSITQASGLGWDARLLPLFRTDLAPDADIDDWWSPGWRERHPQTGDVAEAERPLLENEFMSGVLAIAHGLWESGVRLGVGTDVGNSWMTPGHVYHHELELYQEAGIPPNAILAMATRDGAAALGLEAELGTLEVGRLADIVVLTKDPTRDIRATRSIELVLQAGRRVASGR